MNKYPFKGMAMSRANRGGLPRESRFQGGKVSRFQRSKTRLWISARTGRVRVPAVAEKLTNACIAVEERPFRATLIASNLCGHQPRWSSFSYDGVFPTLFHSCRRLPRNQLAAPVAGDCCAERTIPQQAI